MIREAAQVTGDPLDVTIEKISRQCGVSLLRAHRLARGWTLQEVAERMRATTPSDETRTTRVSHPNVSRWETGSEKPSSRNLNALCQIYQTRPDKLGFGADYTGPQQTPASGRNTADGPASDDIEDPMKRRDVLHGLMVTTGLGLNSRQAFSVEDTRRSIMDLLENRPAISSSVMWWEEQAHNHAMAYRTKPALHLLSEVVADLDDVRQALEKRQSLDTQYRLTVVAAQLSGLLGILHVDLGFLRDARRWFRTAQRAAEETSNQPLRAWLQVREALAVLYHGSAGEAVLLARGARRLAGPNGSTMAAMAPAVEARALVLTGQRKEAVLTINRAERVFEALPNPADVPAVFGFSEAKFRFYQGNVLARAGNISSTNEVHQRALRLYPAHDRVDRAHIRLDQALTLLRQGEVVGACGLMTQVIDEMSGTPEVAVIVAQSREIRSLITGSAAKQAAVRDFDELLSTLTTRT
ncbi:helix-turn-helix transcriptional regulator [Actinocorallia sp. A-T 12471]|uniref:helix-turn-helix transcriptional regulator n=1 Tax=Actinocorallia sp. A-T 12471 TaxID=3089813 RepID=UPI0029CC6C53|nr:helix-turn-helix transcriptional regulator [Actinocorallia sp. A-T 12471]MDX6743910.1 helix-turn-helix transcriptional regulator [Actinocorallia sp. A-T 12471]